MSVHFRFECCTVNDAIVRPDCPGSYMIAIEWEGTERNKPCLTFSRLQSMRLTGLPVLVLKVPILGPTSIFPDVAVEHPLCHSGFPPGSPLITPSHQTFTQGPETSRFCALANCIILSTQRPWPSMSTSRFHVVRRWSCMSLKARTSR